MAYLLAALEPGTVVDNRFEIEALLGSGGMGAVYRVKHVKIGRPAAIKVLHPQIAHSEQISKRFQREARAAGSIGHRNICEVTDICFSNTGHAYLVMPLLQGDTLFELLSKEELSLARLGDIFRQILDGLEAAHDCGIIHRDLKPDNIFITKDDAGSDLVKILDFGISKVVSDDEGHSSMTRTGTVFGTPHFMAPEQARGAKDADYRADLYSVAIMLYEALTGSRPHRGDSWNEVMFNILNEPLEPPCTLNSKISPELEAMLLNSLEKLPENRFQRAVDMQQALETAISAYVDPNLIISVKLRSRKRVDPAIAPTLGQDAHPKKDSTDHDGQNIWDLEDSDFAHRRGNDSATVLKKAPSTPFSKLQHPLLSSLFIIPFLALSGLALQGHTPPPQSTKKMQASLQFEVPSHSNTREAASKRPLHSFPQKVENELKKSQSPLTNSPSIKKEPLVQKRHPNKVKKKSKRIKQQTVKKSSVIEGYSGSVFFKDY